MNRNYERAVTEFVRLMDVAIIFMAFYTAYYIRDATSFALIVNNLLGSYLAVPLTPDFRIENLEHILWVIVPLWLFLFSYGNTYDFERTETLFKAVRNILWVHLVGAMLISAYIFSTNAYEYKRSFFLLFIVLSVLFTSLVRFAVQMGLRYIRIHGRNRHRAVIIGSGSKALKALTELESHPYWGFNIEGVISARKLKEKTLLGLQVLGTIGDLEKILRGRPVDDVFVAVDDEKYLELKSILKVCENIGITVHLLPDKYDMEIAQSSVSTFGQMQFVTFFTIQNNLVQRAVKRVMDIAVSASMLPFLLITYLVVGIFIKLDSNGPIIYKSRRLTRNRRPFVFYKFRTMVSGAEEKFELVSGQDKMEGPISKIEGDPRVTRTGRFLRKYSIDELPQMINVLLGDMSLVGPRPPTPAEVSHYSMSQLRRLSMQQGLTGLWQVNGRDKVVRFEDRLKLDLEYIDNWSLWLDLKILFKTFSVVLKGAM